MSGDSAMPDFEDLLAAYDIPDMTVRIREATAEDGPPADGDDDDAAGPGDENTSKEDSNSGNGKNINLVYCRKFLLDYVLTISEQSS